MITQHATDWRRASTRIGVSYFCFYGSFGTWLPFATMYYKSLDFTGGQIAILTAMPAVWAMLTGPIWGSFADSRSAHRMILRLAPLIAAIASFGMGQFREFAPVLGILAIQSFAQVPIPSFLDMYALVCGDRGGASFGFLRIFGSIGFSVVVTLMGWAMGGEVSAFNLLCLAAAQGVLALVLFGLPPISERQSSPLTEGLRFVMRNRSYVLLLLVAFLLAIAFQGINMFFAIHVSALGGSTSMIGVSFAISAMSELPFIGLGSWWLRRLGARNMISIAIALYILRFAILGMWETPVGAMVGSAVHGASYGGFLVASITLAHRTVGGRYAATAQAMLSMMSFGLGAIVGSIIGGAVIGVSTITIYRASTVLCIAALLLWVAGHRIVERLDNPVPIPVDA